MKRKHLNSIQQTEKDLNDLANGFRGFLPKNTGLVIGGVPFTPQTFVKTLEEHIQLYEEARDAHELLAEKTRVRDEKAAVLHALLKNTRKFLAGYFGEESAKLRDFGIEPAKKRAELTAKQKAEKAEKAKQTRAKNRRGGGVTA